MAKVEFLASFPPIQSAIKVGQDGMRIQLDIPESEMGEAVKLLAIRDQVLKVTIEVMQYGTQSRSQSTGNGRAPRGAGRD